MDDLETRLRRDADTQPDLAPPSLAAAMARVRAGHRRPSRVLPLAVAAGVVVIAGGGAIAGGVLSTNHSTHQTAGGSSVGTLPPHMALRGVWLEAHRTRVLHVVIGYTAGATFCPPLYAGDARLTSQVSTVQIRVDAYAVGEQPPPGTNPSTLVPYATSSAPAPLSTTEAAPASDCEDAPDLLVNLARPVADRPVVVNGQRVVATEVDYPTVGALPDGYVLSRGESVDPTHPSRAVHSRYRGPGGAQLIVSYGPADALTESGTRSGRASVHGRTATVRAGNGTRTITWTLPGGTGLQVQSIAATPLTTAVLLDVARGLH